ncbi:MAG: helix-turn-helix domain-containing protein [Ignavibacteriales bacterium]|nr:helix-turn-helix domain-containing protein [Ignavibacteriales bacterium]
MKKPTPREIDELYRVILRLDSVEECRKFFRDLLTETEISELTERWKAAKMLAQGASYASIAAQTGLSSRTIARVGRWLKTGKGGYVMMLTRSTKSHS